MKSGVLLGKLLFREPWAHAPRRAERFPSAGPTSMHRAQANPNQNTQPWNRTVHLTPPSTSQSESATSSIRNSLSSSISVVVPQPGT